MKKLIAIILTLGSAITLSACGNNDKKESSSETKIDKTTLNELQGDWDTNNSQPSNSIDGKTITTEVGGFYEEYKLIEAKDNTFKGKDDDGDTVEGTFSGSNLTFQNDGGDSHDVEKN